MISASCMHCKSLIAGGVLEDLWSDASKGPLEDTLFCKDAAGNVTKRKHAPHIWNTKGYGEAVYDNQYHRHIFTKAPLLIYNLGVGEFVPIDWEVF